MTEEELYRKEVNRLLNVTCWNLFDEMKPRDATDHILNTLHHRDRLLSAMYKLAKFELIKKRRVYAYPSHPNYPHELEEAITRNRAISSLVRKNGFVDGPKNIDIRLQLAQLTAEYTFMKKERAK